MSGKATPADFSGAKLAVLVGESLLVLQRDDRPDIPFPGQWDLPGGGREGEETPLDCALRETREELHLQIAPEAVHWGRDFGGTLPGQGRVWLFVTRDDGLDLRRVRLGDEGQRWALMPLAAYLAHPQAIAPLVQRLRTYLAESGGAGRAAPG